MLAKGTQLYVQRFSGGSGGSGDPTVSTESGSTASVSTFTVTVGDGIITIDLVETSVSRVLALTEGCSYNVYIASESGLTSDNYSALSNGARYENITFPFSITGLQNGLTYYVIVSEVCVGVETSVGVEVASVPTPQSGDTSTSDGGSIEVKTDRDEDGIPDSSDNCPNASNANQADADNDGFGDVCDSSPNGPIDADGDNYVSVATGGNDCNDGNASINPGAYDIPGNGVDEDCSGSDAPANVDADGDGFFSVPSGGNDCNDGDSSIYPGATEILSRP